MYHYTDCGLQNVWLLGGYIKHDTEYGEAISIHDLHGLHKIIGLNMVHKTPLLSCDDVRFLRKEMTLTQNNLANMLGVSEDTIRGWENRSQISTPAETLLRKLYLEHIHGDGSLRELIEELRLLDCQRAEQERQFSFEENSHAWTLAA